MGLLDHSFGFSLVMLSLDMGVEETSSGLDLLNRERRTRFHLGVDATCFRIDCGVVRLDLCIQLLTSQVVFVLKLSLLKGLLDLLKLLSECADEASCPLGQLLHDLFHTLRSECLEPVGQLLHVGMVD